MTENFQDGCNSIVDKLKELGVTPSSNSPTDIITAIETLKTNSYNNGYNNGKNSVKTCSGGTYYLGGGTTAQVHMTITHNGRTIIDAEFNRGSTPLSGSF